jgi:hypothetical protein
MRRDATVAGLGALQHVTADRLQAVEHTGQVDIDDRLPVGQRHLVDHGRTDDAGIVEQAVDGAVPGHHRFDHALYERRVRDAAGMHVGVAADQLGGLTCAVAVDIHQHQARAEAGGLQGHAATDALRGAGHDDHAVGEIHWVFHGDSLSGKK